MRQPERGRSALRRTAFVVVATALPLLSVAVSLETPLSADRHLAKIRSAVDAGNHGEVVGLGEDFLGRYAQARELPEVVYYLEMAYGPLGHLDRDKSRNCTVMLYRDHPDSRFVSEGEELRASYLIERYEHIRDYRGADRERLLDEELAFVDFLIGVRRSVVLERNARVLRAHLLCGRSRTREAVNEYMYLLGKWPEDSWTVTSCRHLGYVLADNRDFAVASWLTQVMSEATSVRARLASLQVRFRMISQLHTGELPHYLEESEKWVEDLLANETQLMVRKRAGLLLAHMRMMQNRRAEGEALYAGLLRQYPDDTEVLTRYSDDVRQAVQKKDLDSAVKLNERLAEVGGEEAIRAYMDNVQPIVTAYGLSNRSQDLEELLDRVKRIASKASGASADKAAALALVRVYQELGRAEEAARIAGDLFKRYPKDSPLLMQYQLYVRRILDAHHFDSGAASNKAFLQSDHPRAAYLYAKNLIQVTGARGDFVDEFARPEMVQEARTMVQAYPDFSDRERRDLIRFLEADIKTAFEWLRKIRSFAESTGETGLWDRTLVVEGDFLLVHNIGLQTTENFLLDAIGRAKGDAAKARVCRNLAIHYCFNDLFGKAVPYFQQARLLEPENAALSDFWSAVCEMLDSRNYSEGREKLAALARNHPRSAWGQKAASFSAGLKLLSEREKKNTASAASGGR